ncbi:MAG: peptide chain release factor N(5)-glutamine methyltransferase [Candidatus Omnitrophota bacterium]
MARDLRYIVKSFFPACGLGSFYDSGFLNNDKVQCLENIKRLYLEKIPLAYILGKEEFYGIEFKVNPSVLVPRKETELIVEEALDIIDRDNIKCVLDLCCGSANIAISIKKVASQCRDVFACDISAAALAVAGWNVCSHKADIKLVRSDLLSGFRSQQFSMIVTNPPYVESKAIDSSLRHEPRVALDGGVDGLDIIKKVLLQAPFYLKKDGYLVMEIGYNQKEAVNSLIERFAWYKIVKWIKDYDNNWRGIILKKTIDYRP